MYLEVMFRLLNGINIFNISILYVLLFGLCLSLLLGSIIKFFGSKVLFLVVAFGLCLVYEIQLCVYRMFGFYFDFSLLGASEQVMSFASDGIRLILNNIVAVLLILLPFLLFCIFNKKIRIEKDKWYVFLIKVCCSILVYFGYWGCLYINKDDSYSAFKLYYEVNNNELNIKMFGVVKAFLIDAKRQIWGFEEKIHVEDEEKTTQPNEVVYDYNNLDIDFDTLIMNESDNVVKSMHEYFKSDSGTLQNEYTGMFEGKNLILIMAESFNEIAVREDTTPTLYKLVHNGFVFENFYTPTISSTIGGEFQELTGLVAASGFLSPWKSGENYFPMGVANVYQSMGYNTYAYHNNSYTFQNRYKYLEALGFNNFKACKNGLEKLINCNIWPESDVEMIEATVDDYINSTDPFMVFYATVSGHGDYSFSMSAMAKKHKSEVSHLNYSEKPLSYLAAQIELNDALEILIDKLEEAGKLDDTVIALVGDHYPYYLSLDEVNEIASYEKDSVVEINHSNFILWNNNMDRVVVDKVGSQIDVLPTIYNLFGVKYDSRLIIGKDILSTTPGLAIFGNSSWVSDLGTYFASSNKFVAKDGEEIPEGYVEKMNNIVSNKIVMSKYILTKDYYRKVLGD